MWNLSGKYFSVALLASLLILSGQAFAGGSVSDFTTSPREPHGKVSGDLGQPTRDIYPVRIVRLNGHNIPAGGREMLWLTPGEYELQLSVTARMLRAAPGNLRPRRDERMQPLQLTVEEGASYRIGAMHLHDQPGTGRRAWAPVVWKITDAEGATRYPVREGEYDFSNDGAND